MAIILYNFNEYSICLKLNFLFQYFDLEKLTLFSTIKHCVVSVSSLMSGRIRSLAQQYCNAVW